jgi:putative transcriptional regulator
MKTVRVKIDPSSPRTAARGRVDHKKLDATTEADLRRQQREDDAEAMANAAEFVKRVRQQLGLTQLEFSQRIEVPLETIRNWEQGKRSPTGAAKALLKVLDKSPKIALLALS